jgi:hypothetical protein
VSFSLKNHPFGVDAFFQSSLVLTYALPEEQLKDLIPECLTLDTFGNRWAFLAVAMVKTQHLRPKGFPEWMGHDFFLTGFRVFVRYTTCQGKRLRGLYILRSETDQWRMKVLGNLFTHYNYTATDIAFSRTPDTIGVYSERSDLDIAVRVNTPDAALPGGSPFRDWKEARRFAGPLPFTFTWNPETREVLIIEGVRQNWVPGPAEVIRSKIGFIGSSRFNGATLASAFLVENIPYYWKKGELEKWQG